MKISSEIRFVDRKLKAAFYRLEKGDVAQRELFKFLGQALDNLHENAFSGIQIPKRIIPKEFIVKYQLRNLWKYDLPKGWRILYSVMNDGILVVSVILEWMDHKEYQRRLHY